jgi:hypothetical protein
MITEDERKGEKERDEQERRKEKRTRGRIEENRRDRKRNVFNASRPALGSTQPLIL